MQKAKARVRVRLTAIVDPSVGKPSSSSSEVTVDEYAGMWLREVSLRRKPQTVERYQLSYRLHVAEELGDQVLDDVGRQDLKRLIVKQLEAGVGPGAVRFMIRVLSALFSSAYDEGFVSRHPAQRLARLLPSPAAAAESKAMTAAELARFLAVSITEPLYYDLFRVMALSGMRPGEARALQVKDVRPDEYRVHVVRTFSSGDRLSPSPKSGRSRRVEIPRELAIDLRARVMRRKPEEWLFHRGGRPLLDNASREAFHRVVRRAELPKHFTPHSLRHTYASLLIQQGVRAEYIQRQLGHSSIAITVNVYGRWLELANPTALDRLMDSVSGVAEDLLELLAKKYDGDDGGESGEPR